MARDNFHKLWIQDTLNRHTVNRVSQIIENTGRALPCSVTAINGSIVTVKFEVESQWTLPEVTIPKNESPWVRSCTQVGDKGYCAPADYYLGGISGLGGGTADLSKRGNLSTLVFTPVSNISSPPDDVNSVQLTGVDGFIVRTVNKVCSMIGTLTTLTLTCAGYTLVINSSGITLTAPTTNVDGNLVVSGTITGNGTGGATMSGPISSTASISGSSLSAGNGASGSFTVESGSVTITVVDGIITGIS